MYLFVMIQADNIIGRIITDVKHAWSAIRSQQVILNKQYSKTLFQGNFSFFYDKVCDI